MDDNRSILSSIYWDTTSIRSDSTLTADCFHTPTGSFLNLTINDQCKISCASESESVTPQGSELQAPLSNESVNVNDDVLEVFEVEVQPVCTEMVRRAAPERPPKLEKCSSVQLDTRSKSPDKKDWKQSFVKRLSFTKSRIMKSFSVSKQDHKAHIGPRNVFLNMRNSIRRLRSSEKRKSTLSIDQKEPKTVKDTLGSDCDYFNFERCSVERTSDAVHEGFPEGTENTPIKPRRQFPQDKYLTGSEEMLQKAYNSLNRKSQFQEDKSLFDLCSTLSYLFKNEDGLKLNDAKEYIADCLNAFLEINSKQIEHGLLLINKDLGRYFDLMSDDLEVIDDTKKYKVEQLLGSPGVCIITDVESRQRFIGLKRVNPRNWVSFTGFLQHIDKEDTLLEEQVWVCYAADSITNMYLERDCFEPRLDKSKFILDTLLQLMVLLHSQLTEECRSDIKPSNVLLISSHLSLICVFDHSNLSPEKQESALVSINIKGDESMRLSYQESLMTLNSVVDHFLSHAHNSYHLISASYPLDYLFYILLKLNKDIKGLLKTL